MLPATRRADHHAGREIGRRLIAFDIEGQRNLNTLGLPSVSGVNTLWTMNHRIPVLIALLFLGGFLPAILAQPGGRRAAAPPEGTVVHRDLAYVSDGHPRQKLDLYLPREGDSLPLIINIHGGAFRMGSKEDGVPIEYLERGYAVAS